MTTTVMRTLPIVLICLAHTFGELGVRASSSSGDVFRFSVSVTQSTRFRCQYSGGYVNAFRSRLASTLTTRPLPARNIMPASRACSFPRPGAPVVYNMTWLLDFPGPLNEADRQLLLTQGAMDATAAGALTAVKAAGTVAVSVSLVNLVPYPPSLPPSPPSPPPLPSPPSPSPPPPSPAAFTNMGASDCREAWTSQGVAETTAAGCQAFCLGRHPTSLVAFNLYVVGTVTCGCYTACTVSACATAGCTRYARPW